MGLRITTGADYAIRAMIHLACLPEGTLMLREEIAEAERIPSSFMAKILRYLVRGQLLRSVRGVNGGFALARPPSEITLLEIVQAVEGPMQLTPCTGASEGCEHTGECPAASIWDLVQGNMQAILAHTTLESLVSTPRRNGRVANGEPPWVESAVLTGL
jgi:Rrf2 family protein